jgi:hypothetical protein
MATLTLIYASLYSGGILPLPLARHTFYIYIAAAIDREYKDGIARTKTKLHESYGMLMVETTL